MFYRLYMLYTYCTFHVQKRINKGVAAHCVSPYRHIYLTVKDSLRPNHVMYKALIGSDECIWLHFMVSTAFWPRETKLHWPFNLPVMQKFQQILVGDDLLKRPAALSVIKFLCHEYVLSFNSRLILSEDRTYYHPPIFAETPAPLANGLWTGPFTVSAP